MAFGAQGVGWSSAERRSEKDLQWEENSEATLRAKKLHCAELNLGFSLSINQQMRNSPPGSRELPVRAGICSNYYQHSRLGHRSLNKRKERKIPSPVAHLKCGF